MNNILTLIDDLQNNIFAYQIDQISGHILKLVEGLTSCIKDLTVEEQTVLNEILSALLASYEKKDYLLVADLLEFELKPFLHNISLEHQ